MILNVRKQPSNNNDELNDQPCCSKTVQTSLDTFIDIDSVSNLRNRDVREINIVEEIHKMETREKLLISEDVFDFWENNLLQNPENTDLYNIAVTVLAAPASQSSIENGFSALALILRKDRTRTSSENLDNIMIINLNRQFLDKVIYDY